MTGQSTQTTNGGIELWFAKRPPPLRIKSTKELDPGFRPRWVKLRVWMMLGAVVLLMSCFWFIEQRNAMMVFITLFLVIFSGSLATNPRETCAAIGFLLRHFPKLALHHAKFEHWLEFDLDWDETRR